MANSGTEQFSTFFVADRIYGINVRQVQEIVKPMDMTKVPLAPGYVRGLINLRGQVATAIGLRELFELDHQATGELMNVVCKLDGNLISFQVDEIGDVVEVEPSSCEPIPQTIPENIRRFMTGVYRVNDQLLSVLDNSLILKHLNEFSRNEISRQLTQAA